MSAFGAADRTLSSAPTVIAAAHVSHGMPVVFLLCIFVVLLPSIGTLPGLSIYDSKRILQVGLLLLNGLWILLTLGRSRGPIVTYSLLPKSSRRLVTLVLLAGCGSATVALFPVYGLLEVFHLILAGSLTLTVAHFYRHGTLGNDKLLGTVVVLSAALYLVSFCVGYVMHLSQPIGLWPSGYTGFGHVRFFNQFQTWTLPILVLVPVVVGGGDRWKRNLLLMPAVGWWMLLFASGGRGTLLGIVGASLVVIAAFGRRAVPWLKLQGIAAAAGGIAYGLLFKIVASTNVSLVDRNVTTDMGRFYYWDRAVDMARENWLLGIGPMHHASFTTEYWSHPHNTVLQWAAEWGVPATALLAIVMIWGFASWIRQCRSRLRAQGREQEGHVRVALTAAMAAPAVHALFSGITIMPMSQTIGALLLGWTLGLFLLGRAAEKPLIERPPSSFQRLLLVALFCLGLGVVAWSTASDALRRSESEEQYLRKVNPNHFHPRYWRQGAIRY